MFHLVTGGSGSGKSAYAEQKIYEYYKSGSGGGLFYIATMIPYGEEAKKKIARHRTMRAEKGFETIECYTDLEYLVRESGLFQNAPGFIGVKKNLEFQEFFEKTRKKPCVLLECMSNLTANELYEESGAGKQTEAYILEGVRTLYAHCRHLVIVTNEVCSDIENGDEMEHYKRTLSEINRQLAQWADEVTEVVYGVSVPVKRRGSEKKTDFKLQIGCEETGKGTMEEALCKEKMKDVLHKGIHIVTGGAYQGKLRYAKQVYGENGWADGAKCPLREIETCGKMYHFESYIRRWMEEGNAVESLVDTIIEKNTNLILVVSEIGSGLVPIDAFDREYREQAGRICTRLAEHAVCVVRVVCGIGMTLKSKESTI